MAKTNDALVKAVTEGDVLQVLLTELQDSCDMNAMYNFKDRKGYDWKTTPLIAAAAFGQTELVESLLTRADIDVNAIDETENTALHAAAEKGKLDIVKLLLANPKTEINRRGEYAETPLYKAAEQGKVDVLNELLAHPEVQVNLGNEEGVTPLQAAAESGRIETLKILLERCAGDREQTDPALYKAAYAGKVDVVKYLLERDDANVNYTDKVHIPTASLQLNACVVRQCRDDAPLARPTWHQCQRSNRRHSALMNAAMYGYLEVVTLLLEHGADTSIEDKNGNTCLDLALKEEEYFPVVIPLLASGMVPKSIVIKDKLLIELVAAHLTVDVALDLLRKDLPAVIEEDGTVVALDEHNFSWTTFLDSHVPVPTAVRVAVVKTLLEGTSDDFVREMAAAKDQNGRSALQTTDAATREFLNGLLFFCGRYEIFEGPAIHVSATAVVVNAYDHGVFQQVFQEFATDGELDKAGFQECGLLLGYQATSKKPDLTHDFDLWDKDRSGHLSEAEYLRYCDQMYGGKLKVAMKFMRNADEHEREIKTRQGLHGQYVLGLLPMLPQETFQANVTQLTLHGGVAMADYPNVLVMPAADRSLEDIFLKERPNDNQIRSMLHQVAEALQHLHDKGIVHGDLKKLNVLRVNHRMKVIDMDAATPIGAPVGAKFSSGSLPPEMFYKLQSDAEVAAYRSHWHDANPELWQKVEPKDNWVVKTFDSAAAAPPLPYKLVKASPSLDVWAFGALMYQMYSGVELVPTNVNQDVDETGIARAATWTSAELTKRIHNKVTNDVARDLILKLLEVDPDERMSVTAMLAHPYFHVKMDGSAAILDKLDGLKDQIETGFNKVQDQLNQVVELSKENLKALGNAKADLMRGIFEATEVAFPTSFVILPFNLTEPQDDAPEDTLHDVASFLQKGIEMGNEFMKALRTNRVVDRALRLVGPGQPLYLYLIDEVEGLPVVPPPSSVYPIRIETKSDEYVQFMSAAMPYIQTGFRLLRGANTVANMLQYMGVPSIDLEVVDQVGQQIEDAKKTSSAFDFDVVQSAVEAEDNGVPVEHIRGAALRELERFFARFDQDKDFAGLSRTYASNGQALWTSKTNVAKLQADRPASTNTLKATHDAQNGKPTAGKTPQQVYIELLQRNDLPVPPSQVVQVRNPDHVGHAKVEEFTPRQLPSDHGERPHCCALM
ncbi:serine/threonine protein kinase [Aphanomyces euteiches]|nr:serine/threonine protein kinase [Aphanomyces euteiches]